MFSISSVQVGDYKIEVEAPGFKKAVVTDVHAVVAKSYIGRRSNWRSATSRRR